MTEKQLAKIFEFACAGSAQKPNEDKFEVWKPHLGRYEEAEVRAAVLTWQGDVTAVLHFDELRPRGSIMPSATEIKAIVLQARGRKAESNRYVPCEIDGCSSGYRLELRETRIYGAPEMVRVAVPCSCRKQWEASRSVVSVAATAGPSLSTVVAGVRRVN